MKVKKMLFALLVFLLGMYGVDATNCTINDYNNLEGVYKDLSALSYYHIIYDGTKTRSENEEIFLNDESMKSLYSGNTSRLSALVGRYHEVFLHYGIIGDSGLAKTLFVDHSLNDSTCTKINGTGNDKFLTLLSNRVKPDGKINENLNTIDFLWGQVDGLMYRVIGDIGDEDTISDDDYEDFKKRMEIAYEDFCDYLNSHKGISEFIEMALNIVTYAALALGIFLGILDFIKAISSQDDAALTKAFQAFIKRIAAIALIFLSGVIVTIVVNIVPIWGVNRDATICSQFDLGK